MTTSRKDDLIAWLRYAHAMEAATTDNLERLIARADDYPRLKTQMEHHAEVSRRQKDEIERQLKALGSDTSALKNAGMAGWPARAAGFRYHGRRLAKTSHSCV